MKIESIGWGRRATIRKQLVIEMFSDEPPQIKKRFSSSRAEEEEHKSGLSIRLDSKFKTNSSNVQFNVDSNVSFVET